MDERAVIELHTARAIKQMRNASANLSIAEEIGAVAPTARLLTVLTNSIELFGERNRGQVERALADYFDALVDDPPTKTIDPLDAEEPPDWVYPEGHPDSPWQD